MIDADTTEEVRRVPTTVAIGEIMGIKNIKTRSSIARSVHHAAECIV